MVSDRNEWMSAIARRHGLDLHVSWLRLTRLDLEPVVLVFGVDCYDATVMPAETARRALRQMVADGDLTADELAMLEKFIAETTGNTMPAIAPQRRHMARLHMRPVAEGEN